MADTDRVRFDDDELRRRLTPEQYRVTQRGGTEPPFTGEYDDFDEPGGYRCVVCGAALFRAGEKFHSGCGWPSFSAAADGGSIEELEDNSHGMVRTEVRCKRCGAHLGHVFNDGPPPTGLRYCINSAAIAHEPAPEPAPKPGSDADARGDTAG